MSKQVIAFVLKGAARVAEVVVRATGSAFHEAARRGRANGDHEWIALDSTRSPVDFKPISAFVVAEKEVVAKTKLPEAYAILGVTPEDPLSTIKDKYTHLMKANEETSFYLQSKIYRAFEAIVADPSRRAEAYLDKEIKEFLNPEKKGIKIASSEQK
jgi:hypothetical protein